MRTNDNGSWSGAGSDDYVRNELSIRSAPDTVKVPSNGVEKYDGEADFEILDPKDIAKQQQVSKANSKNEQAPQFVAYKQLKTEINSILENHKAEMAKKEQEHDAKIAKKDKEIEELIQNGKKEITALVQTHQAEREKKDQEYKAEMAKKEQEHDAKIAEKDKEIGKKDCELTAKDEKIAKLESDLASLMVKLMKKDEQLISILNKHRNEMQLPQDNHDTMVNHYSPNRRATIDDLRYVIAMKIEQNERSTDMRQQQNVETGKLWITVKQIMVSDTAQGIGKFLMGKAIEVAVQRTVLILESKVMSTSNTRGVL